MDVDLDCRGYRSPGNFGGCAPRSICYDMNTVDESFEWTLVRSAPPDEVQVLDEKMDLALLQVCPAVALSTSLCFAHRSLLLIQKCIQPHIHAMVAP